MQLAERKWRKLKKGGIAWTPGLSAAKHRITVWMLVIRRAQGCAVSAKTIIWMKQKAGMHEEDTNLSISDATVKLDAAFARYKEYIKDAANKRVEFQTELAAAKAKKGNISVSNVLTAMIRVEEQRASARRIKWMNGKTQNSTGLT